MADTPAQVALDEKGLLPCPFCGGKMMLRKALWPSEGDTDGIIHAEPTDCPLPEFNVGIADQCASVRAAWNSRAAEAGDDGQGALVERARYFVENPSAWESGFDQGASDRLAEILAAYEALTHENAALRTGNKRLETEVEFLRDKAISNARERNAAERRLAEQGQAQGGEVVGLVAGDGDPYFKIQFKALADTQASPEPDAELVEAWEIAEDITARAEAMGLGLAKYPVEHVRALLSRHRKQGGA